MNITKAPAEFRPVTVTLETQDELDKFLAIVASVAENRVNHTPQVMRAAIDMRREILQALEGDE